MAAAAVVAVERLDDAREAEPVGRRDRFVLGRDDGAARDGQPGRVEEPVRQAFVRRDVDGDARGLRGHRRPDPLVVEREPELDERVGVEPDVGDVAAGRLVEDRLRRRPEGLLFGQADEGLELRHEVEVDRRVARGDEVIHEADRELAGVDSDARLAELVDHVVAAVLAGAARLAVTNVGAGEVLELEGDVLGDVAGPGSIAEPRDEAAATAEAAGVVLEAREELDEGVGEARDLVRRVVLEDAEIDDHPDDRFACPVVGATEDPRLDDHEGRLRASAVGGAIHRAACRARRSSCRDLRGRRRLRPASAWLWCRLCHAALLPPARPFAGPERTRPWRRAATSRRSFTARLRSHSPAMPFLAYSSALSGARANRWSTRATLVASPGLAGAFDAINGITGEGANSDVSEARLRWTGAACATLVDAASPPPWIDGRVGDAWRRRRRRSNR